MRSVARRSSISWSVMAFVLGGFIAQPFAAADSREEDELQKRRSPANETASPLLLHLIWYDNYELLPRSFEIAAGEVRRIFGELGVEVRWHVGEDVEDQASAARDPAKLYVVLLPSRSESLGLGRGVMGVATHGHGMKGSVYIFYPEVTDILNIDPALGEAKAPRAAKCLARAIGRVVAHELVHVLAPYHPHSATGLMDTNLSRRFLVQPRAHLDQASSRVVRAEIRALGSRVLSASDGPAPNIVPSAEDEWAVLLGGLLPHPRQ